MFAADSRGYLLQASPWAQFVAQVVGAFASIWLCTVFFLLFASAYPCILQVSSDSCPFGIPSVQAWRVVAEAVTTADSLPIPTSCLVVAVLMGLVSVLVIVVKHRYASAETRVYVPNMNAVGLAFTLPQTYYSTAMLIGAFASYYWHKRDAKGWELAAIAIAAGLTAGEGVGGIFNAMLALFNIGGATLGTAALCPCMYRGHVRRAPANTNSGKVLWIRRGSVCAYG